MWLRRSHMSKSGLVVSNLNVLFTVPILPRWIYLLLRIGYNSCLSSWSELRCLCVKLLGLADVALELQRINQLDRSFESTFGCLQLNSGYVASLSPSSTDYDSFRRPLSARYFLHKVDFPDSSYMTGAFLVDLLDILFYFLYLFGTLSQIIRSSIWCACTSGWYLGI